MILVANRRITICDAHSTRQIEPNEEFDIDDVTGKDLIRMCEARHKIKTETGSDPAPAPHRTSAKGAKE